MRNRDMVWLGLVGSLKLQVSFAKEPYKRDAILQKRPMILKSLLIVATPYVYAQQRHGTKRALKVCSLSICMHNEAYIQAHKNGIKRALCKEPKEPYRALHAYLYAQQRHGSKRALQGCILYKCMPDRGPHICTQVCHQKELYKKNQKSPTQPYMHNYMHHRDLHTCTQVLKRS